MKRQLVLMTACLLLVFYTNKTAAQGATKNTDKWYNSRVWLHGLKRTASPTINKTELAKQYKTNKLWWDSAFSYLKNTDLPALKPGKYTIYGNDDVYVRVTEAAPKSKEDVLFEAHKDYADIHCVVSGEEMIGIAPYASVVLKKEYDAANDIAFYTTAKGKYYLSNASTLFIMFPEKDAHCGGIKVKTDGTIKKVVIKVRTSK